MCLVSADNLFAKTTDLVFRQTAISLNVVTKLNAVCRNSGLTPEYTFRSHKPRLIKTLCYEARVVTVLQGLCCSLTIVSCLDRRRFQDQGDLKINQSIFPQYAPGPPIIACQDSQLLLHVHCPIHCYSLM